MRSESIVVVAEDPSGADAVSLMAELDRELRTMYPDASIHGATPAELCAPRASFLVARIGGQAVGCGALRPLDDTAAEVKRMFVRAEFRGRGIGRIVLLELESVARARGFRTLRLETGSAQPEAIRLYESEGYRRIPAFGEYADDPRSVCFEKEI